IGVALLPIIPVFTTAMRNVAGGLLPLMQAMAPILEQLANSLASLLLPTVQGIVDVFQALMPIIQLAAGLFTTLAESFKVGAVILRTFIDTLIAYLASLFGGADLKGVADRFRDVLRQMIVAIVQFTALIARSLGQFGFVQKLIDNLNATVKPAAGAAPAP